LHQGMVRPYKAGMPVICIGNLVAGGSGKTPVSLAIMQLVKDNMLAEHPCFLSRGYGGKAKGYFLVNRESHTADDTGDEPLLLAEKAPVIIAPDRRDGARYAESNNFDLVVMDDGLQNPGLYKDIRFVVIDGATGFGNGKCLPAGPLREPLAAGLRNADAFIVIGKDCCQIQSTLPKGKPIFFAHLNVPESWISDKKIPYIAFCGLAHPDKFQTTLVEAGLNIVGWIPYPDHYRFTARDLQCMSEKAKRSDARLITTEKDAVRIPQEFRRAIPLDILPVEIQWEDGQALVSFLKDTTGTL